MDNFLELSDEILMAHELGLLNDAYTPYFPKIVEISNFVQYFNYSRQMIGNLGAGLLMHDIQRNMNGWMAEGTPKYIHYSAHDTTIQYLISTLGLDVHHPDLRNIPGLGATFVLELHRNSTGFYVQAQFSNSSTSEWVNYPLSYFGCGDACEFSEFTREVIEHSTPTDWCRECDYNDADFCLKQELTRSANEKTVVYILFFVILMPIITLAIPMLIYFYFIKTQEDLKRTDRK